MGTAYTSDGRGYFFIANEQGGLVHLEVGGGTEGLNFSVIVSFDEFLGAIRKEFPEATVEAPRFPSPREQIEALTPGTEFAVFESRGGSLHYLPHRRFRNPGGWTQVIEDGTARDIPIVNAEFAFGHLDNVTVEVVV